MAVDDASFLRPQRTDAEQFLFHGTGRIAADHFAVFDAVLLRLHHDGLDFSEFGFVGGDDQLAAFAMADAVGGAKLVEHAAAADAQRRAQRVGGVIKTGVDHLGIARRNAIGDAAGDFGHGDVVAKQSRGAGHRQPDHTCTDDEDLHALIQSRFHGMMMRSISLSTIVSTKPIMAMVKRPTYICSTENVSHAVQII